MKRQTTIETPFLLRFAKPIENPLLPEARQEEGNVNAHAPQVVLDSRLTRVRNETTDDD
jgi:hypothetical protein